eukprot:258437_1
MSNKGTTLAESIISLTNAITKLENREEELFSLIQRTPSDPNDTEYKKQYKSINTKKCELLATIITLRKAETEKNALQSMKNASKTMKDTLQYVDDVDAVNPQRQTINIAESLWTDIAHTVDALKNTKDEVQTAAVQLIDHLQQQWTDIKNQRDTIFPELITVKNNINDEEKQLRNKIESKINEAHSSLAHICSNLDTQRIGILEAKCNVRIMEAMSHSDLLYKLILTDGGVPTKHEIDDMDANMNRLEQCMSETQQLHDTLQEECDTTVDNKIKVLIGNKIVSNAHKLNKLQRAMFIVEDIRTDNEIIEFLRDKMGQIVNRANELTYCAKGLRDEAKQYAQAKNKVMALSMLKRKKLFDMQRDEYKLKISNLQKSLGAFGFQGDGDDDTTGGNVKEEKEKSMVQVLDTVVDIGNKDVNRGALSSDYTEWNSDDIVRWIISINPNKYCKYEGTLKTKMSEMNVNGNDLVMLNKSDLQGFGIGDLEDVVEIIKQIEQLASCFTVDLLDEMYDDDDV